LALAEAAEQPTTLRKALRNARCILMLLAVFRPKGLGVWRHVAAYGRADTSSSSKTRTRPTSPTTSGCTAVLIRLKLRIGKRQPAC